MRIEDGSFAGTEAEFAAAAVLAGVENTKLSLVPVISVTPEDTRAAATFRDGLEPSLRTELDESLSALAAPSRIGRFHSAIADESVARALYAQTPRHPDEVFVFASTGDEKRLGSRSVESMRLLVRRVLAADGLGEKGTVAVPLSTPAAVVLLAAIEFRRFSQHASLLRHVNPIETFSIDDLLARLADAATEDFRWPLLFFEKVLPVAIPKALGAADVRAAFAELESAELAEKVEGASPELWAFLPAGEVLADAARHDVSKVAFGVAGVGDDGRLGHESLLLLRSARHLFAYDLIGERAVVGALTTSDLDAVVNRLLAPGSPPAPAGQREQPVPAAEPKSEPAALACAKCRAALPAGSKFCLTCGAPAAAPAPATAPGPTPCGACGAALAASAKFCPTCGAKATPAASSAPPAPAPRPVCRACGQPLAPGVKFCVLCGSRAG